MINPVCNVGSVASSADQQVTLTPMPVVDPTKGKDELQTAFLEALLAFENALNAASVNPDDKFKANALKQAAAKLAVAEKALNTDPSSTADDKAMGANFDSDVALAPELQSLITVASDPKSTVTDVENAIRTIVDPAAWGVANEALQAFSESL